MRLILNDLVGDRASEEAVPDETLTTFCKHVRHIRVVNTSSLVEELDLRLGSPGLERLLSVCAEVQSDLYEDEAQVNTASSLSSIVSFAVLICNWYIDSIIMELGDEGTPAVCSKTVSMAGCRGGY